MTLFELPEVPPEEVRKVLGDAIEALHEKGWARGYFVEDDGGVCLLGAINTAIARLLGYRPNLAYPDPEWLEGLPIPNSMKAYALRSSAERKVRGILHKRGDVVSVPIWNDKIAKDADEVCEVLKLAAEEV